MTNQRMVFPEPAKNADDDEEPISEDLEKHTFSIDPQERSSRLPLAKHTALEEPFGGFPVVKITCDVVVCRWIGGSYPFSETLSRLIP